MPDVMGQEGQHLTGIIGRDLAGFMYMNIYSVGMVDYHLKQIAGDASEVVLRARRYIHPGLHEAPYPHIASFDRSTLEYLMCMVYGRSLGKRGGMIRETVGLIDPTRTCVVFTSGYDSRRVKEDHDRFCPKFIPILSSEIFSEIVEEDPLAFQKAIGIKTPVLAPAI